MWVFQIALSQESVYSKFPSIPSIVLSKTKYCIHSASFFFVEIRYQASEQLLLYIAFYIV